MKREKIIVGWSGGKDSALALQSVVTSGKYEVAALVTTCTEGFDRISMHGVRRSLLEAQAEALQIPLRKVFISKGATNAEYEARMHAAFLEFKEQGISTVAFGDLYLQDIRAYRDRMLGEIGMKTLYPIWGKDTWALANKFVCDGFNAVLVCIDPRRLDKSFAGRNFDSLLLNDLPTNVDPCGENGEFHTFVFQGPVFRKRIPFVRGEIVHRDGFCFCDLLPC